VALWPLLIRADSGQVTIDCGLCDSGQMLGFAPTPARSALPVVIADLTARVDDHVPRCPSRDRVDL
jgi:hypothetical protein